MRFSQPARAWLRELLPLAVALAGIFTAGIWFARPQLTVAAADAHARRTLGGFWALERNATDSFRWARPEAAIRLFGFEQRAPLLVRVRMSAARPADQSLVRLTLASSGPPLELALAREWREYTLLLPAPSPDAEGRLLALRSLADPPYPDPRPLGFALSSLTVAAHPQSPADRLPAGGRLLFLVLAGLAAYVALRRRLACAWAAGLVLLPALALGLALALAPIAVGYWLPSLWLALSLAWLLLLAPALLGWLRPRLAGRRHALPGGLAVVSVALLLLPIQPAWSPGLGWALLLAGAALVVVALGAPGAGALVGVPTLPWEQQRARVAKTPERQALGGATTALALGLITAAALLLRLVSLDGPPPGMWRDEARHGLLALRILQDPTFRPVYVPAIADLPALLFYLIAVPIHLFGPQPWAVRLVPALAGGLTPLALFFLARPLFGARAALIASALLAASAWHITLSRLAFAATLGPPLTLLALGALWRLLAASGAAEQQGAPKEAGPTTRPHSILRPSSFVAQVRSELLHSATGGWAWLGWVGLLGLATGLAVYTYHPARLTPLVVALGALVLLGRRLPAWRAALPGLLLAALLATVVAWPLVDYAIDHRASFSRRVGQTSIFNPDSLEARAPLGRLEESLGLNLGIWLARGDHIGRHNIPDAPQLDILTGVLFAAGAALALAWWRDRRASLVLAWGAVTLVPGVFSIEAPHAVRTVEAIAPSLLLAGMAADALLSRRLARVATQVRRWLPAVVWLIILGLNGWRYFVAWPVQPKVVEQFYVADTQIGLLAQRLMADQAFAAQGGQLFIPSAGGDDDVLRYLTAGLDLPRHAGPQLTQPPGAQALLIAYGDRSDLPPEQAAQALGPAAQRLALGPPMPVTGRPAYVVYGVGDVAAEAVRRALE